MNTDREIWVNALKRIAGPVVTNLAAGTLNENMPHRPEAITDFASRLEAVGRTFCGILPWIDLPDDGTEEGALRAEWRNLVIRGIASGVNPESSDALLFCKKEGCNGQPLVDAAFLAQGLLRAPRLWNDLGTTVQSNVLDRMRSTRSITPGRDNWLLFASIVEALILEKTGTCDEARLMDGVNAFLAPDGWYVGDGLYSDGDSLAIDGYNSFVIQPMLWDVVVVLDRVGHPEAKKFFEMMKPRFRRLTDLLERMISPDGTYPLFGRSICYRFGVFHQLAMAATLGPDFHVASRGAIRAALTAVIKRQCTDVNFDDNGWLTVGFNGTQPSLAEVYISRGSPYLACFIFLPLGLPAAHPFWTDPAEDWTQKAAWSGKQTRIDSAL